MKRILCIAVGGVLLAATASATRVNYAQLRSFGDNINDHQLPNVAPVWSIGALHPPGHPSCPPPAVTVRGAAYAGAINAAAFVVREDDDFIHDIGAVAVFDAAALQAAATTGNYVLHLDQTFNLGMAGVLEVSVLPDEVLRGIMQGTGGPNGWGPFPGNYGHILDTTVGLNGAGGAVGTSDVIRFTPFVDDHQIVLSSGGGANLDVCLGPTGQVRIIDDGNNGDWATECVAGGWRAETITLGGSSPFAAAVAAAAGGASLTTSPFSCSPTALGRSIGGPLVIASPIGVAISVINGGVETDRAEEMMWETLFLGGDNLFVLANDPDFPATDLWIDAF